MKEVEEAAFRRWLKDNYDRDYIDQCNEALIMISTVFEEMKGAAPIDEPELTIKNERFGGEDKIVLSGRLRSGETIFAIRSRDHD